MSTPHRTHDFWLHDIIIIGISVGVAVFFVQTGVIANLLASTENLHGVGSFIAGFFFTSIFTTAPAIVALGEIGRAGALLPNAFFGAIGAVIGDLLIFRFVRDRFSDHILELVGHRELHRRIHTLFKRRLFRCVSLFVGGLIVASPLPDELGVGIAGLSHIKTKWFIPFSFAFNFVGIMLIGLAARSLAS